MSDRFSGVVGHEAARRLLTQAVEAPHHAYLIVGANGVGASLLAERFVRALADMDLEKSLAAHPDVAVLARPKADEEAGIKGSSVIPVELVRELRMRLASRPVMAKRRVAFLPEADRLNEEGANALLKSLEEPPAGAVFVLAATDVSRLPATILSRAVTITLGLVASNVIESWLNERGAGESECGEAARQAAGRPGYAVRWMQDADERVRAAEAARAVDAVLTAADAGAAVAALDAGSRAAETSEDPREAWNEHLDRLMHALREHLLEDPRKSVAFGHALVRARRASGSPVSPRIWMELELVKSFRNGIRFPQHVTTEVV